MIFQYDPIDGFRNMVSFPNPSSDEEGRAQFQLLLDQVMSALSAVNTDLQGNFAKVAELQGIILGQIPNGTITPIKLSFDPATQAELDLVQAKAVGARLYAYNNLGGAL